jgi:hypothetical protein
MGQGLMPFGRRGSRIKMKTHKTPAVPENNFVGADVLSGGSGYLDM